MAAVSPSSNSTSSPVPPASPPPSTTPPAAPPPSTTPPAAPPPSTTPPAAPPPSTPPLASPPISTPPPASPPISTPPPASPPISTPPPASPPPSTPPPTAPPPSSLPPLQSSVPPASSPSSQPPASSPPLSATPPLSSPVPASSPPSTLSPASPPPRNETSPVASPPSLSQSPSTNVNSPPSANPPSSSTAAPPPKPSNPPPPSSSASPQSPPAAPTSVPPPSTVQPSNSPVPTPTIPPVILSPPPSVNPPASPLSPPPPPPKGPPPSQSPVTNPPPASGPPNKSPPPPASGPPNKSPPPPASPPLPASPPPPASPPTKLSTPPSNVPPTYPPPPISVSAPSPGTSPSLPSLPFPSSGSVNDTKNTTSSNSTSSNSGKGIGTGGSIAIGLIFGLLLIGLVSLAAWCIWKQKKRGSGPNNGYVLPTSAASSAPQPDSSLSGLGSSATNTRIASSKDYFNILPESGGLGNTRSWFTYEELVHATDGFAEQNLLGEGGFGLVYKGRLSDGRAVAVKQLKIGGGQGEREFEAEVEIISRINHRNLVSLVGYCISESNRMLVYEYVSNNNLYFHLHGEGRSVMNWEMRVKVAVGAARGIAYLHEDCIPRIIHRDIKSSNILLDDKFEARVSDFGLAKLFQFANTHVSTRVMGTFGYMAPEYAASGKLTEKSDVFSFGVVLLELITGRKSVDTSQPLGDESLVEWARPLLSYALESREFEHLVDPVLEKNYVDTEILKLIEVAAACVRHSSAKRPQMGQVVRAFDTMSNWGNINNGMMVGESQIINSPMQSEEIRVFRRMAFDNQTYSTDFFTGTGSSFFSSNSRLETLGSS